MITTGITGGIGSGKTIVSTVFDKLGYPVYVADKESKQLTQTHPVIRNGLIQLFGKNIFVNGELDKKMLAYHIFNDKEKLRLVNELIHPVVMHDFNEWRNRQSSPIVFIETALLFETDFQEHVDKKILIVSPMPLRIERIKKRDNATENEIKSRIDNQMSDEEKIKLADYVIVNDEKQAILPQIDFLLTELLPI